MCFFMDDQPASSCGDSYCDLFWGSYLCHPVNTWFPISLTQMFTADPGVHKFVLKTKSWESDMSFRGLGVQIVPLAMSG